MHAEITNMAEGCISCFSMRILSALTKHNLGLHEMLNPQLRKVGVSAKWAESSKACRM